MNTMSHSFPEEFAAYCRAHDAMILALIGLCQAANSRHDGSCDDDEGEEARFNLLVARYEHLKSVFISMARTCSSTSLRDGIGSGAAACASEETTVDAATEDDM